jgi:hypothetical protein
VRDATGKTARAAGHTLATRLALGEKHGHKRMAELAGQATTILEGKAATVTAGIRRRATRFGYSTSERKGADHAATYRTGKKPYLNHHAALANGWPIATGIIEGACRHLVKDRMDIIGARIRV